jgi:hypothetical protein
LRSFRICLGSVIWPFDETFAATTITDLLTLYFNLT